MTQKLRAKLIDYSKLKFKIRKSMRYDDVGDYQDTTIVSYDTKDPVLNNAIMLHEFIEYTLVRSAGIPVRLIDKFDTDDYVPSKNKKEYKLYCRYHRIANNVEKHFVENLGMKWKDYQNSVYKMSVKVSPRKKSKSSAKRKVR